MVRIINLKIYFFFKILRYPECLQVYLCYWWNIEYHRQRRSEGCLGAGKHLQYGTHRMFRMHKGRIRMDLGNGRRTDGAFLQGQIGLLNK